MAFEETNIEVDGQVYTLNNNGNKYNHAKTAAGPNATNGQILAHYDKLGGYIKDAQGNKILDGHFWEIERARIGADEKDVANKSEEELEAIIRRAENTHVPRSLFQRAKLELELRDRKNSQQPHVSGIFFEVAGDMRNDGVIQTDKDAVVGVNVRGNYTSKKGKIIQGALPPTESIWSKYRDGIIIGVIGAVLAGLILAWILNS